MLATLSSQPQVIAWPGSPATQRRWAGHTRRSAKAAARCSVPAVAQESFELLLRRTGRGESCLSVVYLTGYNLPPRAPRRSLPAPSMSRPGQTEPEDRAPIPRDHGRSRSRRGGAPGRARR